MKNSTANAVSTADQMEYYVSANGEQQGPFTAEQIVERVNRKTLDASDYLFDEAKQDWIMLMAHPQLSQALKTLKPLSSTSSSGQGLGQGSGSTSASNVSALRAGQSKDGGGGEITEWFVLKGESKFGPFSYPELIKMLQDKSIFEFDYVWHVGLKAWERIATIAEFSPDKVRNFRGSSEGPINEVFFRRRHARAHHGASILVHDNRAVYKGRSIEVSAGGAGIVIENAMLQPGESLYLHFKPGDQTPPFNAACEIISKSFVNASDKSAPVRYGVKFTKIETQTQQILNEFALKKTA